MNTSELIIDYVDGTELLHQTVVDMTDADVRARPIPGTWSTLEVLCHLADSEALFAERMKRVLSEDRPPLLYSDPTNQPTALAYETRDFAEEVAIIIAIRIQMARILRAQPASAWQRIGVHNKEGERTLEQLVQKAIDHLAHHLRFIADKRRALGSHTN